jgi:uncharacterized membrane protein
VTRERSARNISEAERWASMIGGAALTLYGVSRLRRNGWILATFGVLLVRRGFTRHCHTYDLLNMSTAGGSAMLPSRDAEHASNRIR